MFTFAPAAFAAGPCVAESGSTFGSKKNSRRVSIKLVSSARRLWLSFLSDACIRRLFMLLIDLLTAIALSSLRQLQSNHRLERDDCPLDTTGRRSRRFRWWRRGSQCHAHQSSKGLSVKL